MNDIGTDRANTVCACGHDELTHTMKVVSSSGCLGGEMEECFAALPSGWECHCPKFSPQKSAAEIRADVGRARRELEAGVTTAADAFGWPAGAPVVEGAGQEAQDGRAR